MRHKIVIGAAVLLVIGLSIARSSAAGPPRLPVAAGYSADEIEWNCTLSEFENPRIQEMIPETWTLTTCRCRSLRSDNRRILEVIRFALSRSESFQDLVATLDLFDRVVYVQEGSCPDPEHRSCLYLMPDTRNLVVHIDPRQSIRTAAAALAHELYHAVEIGRAPEVVDSDSLRSLYERIGELSCREESRHRCWETRAAQAFEALVMRQLANGNVKTHSERRTTGEDRGYAAW